MSLLSKPSRQLLCLLKLALEIAYLFGDLFVLADEALQFVLGLVQRILQDSVLLLLLADLILQFTLLVEKLVPFFDKLDLVLKVGVKLISSHCRGSCRIGARGLIPRVRHVLLRLLKLELLQVHDARLSLFQSSQELLFLHTLHI